MRNLLILFMLLFGPAAFAQSQPKLTNPSPVLVTTGLTYQQLLPMNGGRLSLTIQNNNASDQCEILVGGPWVAGDTTSTSRTVSGVSVTALQGAIVLPAGQAYTRYYPYVPSDRILGTCTTTGDSIYVDTQ
jgi:hypothetical protein